MNNLRNIQALRGLAALAVVTVHMDFLRQIAGIPANGAAGVDLFFVISGFVMTLTISRSAGGTAFLLGRLARIAPMYWLVTLAVFAVAVLHPQLLGATTASTGELLKSLAFIPFIKSNGLVQPMLLVGWTLNLEMFFYLILALSYANVSSSRSLALTAAGLLTITAFGYLDHPSSRILQFYCDPIVIEFIFGMVIAKFMVNGNLATRIHPFVLLSGAIMAAVLLFTSESLLPHLPRAIGEGLPAALLVFLAIQLEQHGFSVRSVAILAIGDASYSLYLTHLFVVRLMQKLLLPHAAQPLAAFGAIALSTMAAALVALVAYRYLEKPLSLHAKRLALRIA